MTAGCGLSDEDAALVAGVRARRVRALARTITLIESSRADHQARAQQVLKALLPETGQRVRVGISGAPGVGKSTFIEALGLYLIGQGQRVAVLAVDPSSSVNGGSILGDKTRMERLSMTPHAYIRPSPAAGSPGGVAAHTREAMLVCEAAGFDVVIIETVGVGQSETAVAAMTDTFVLLQQAHGGDDLQAIKKGIVELADVMVFNKADLDRNATRLAMGQMQNALRLLRNSSHWAAPVLAVSAASGEGIDAFWDAVLQHRKRLAASGQLTEKRRKQAVDWMWTLIDMRLQKRFHNHGAVQAALPEQIAAVAAGCTTPAAAAAFLLDKL
ncbi:methylmalonyl Co-A mutase-associated GTPase MeaB [Noviherbaspirillum sp.]|uniref:methylmalonyl Co-A mutase-associated GTPase MeaB n=1 Tax=Noviherbaspirillum sp. TaxID=1926288 RepID=UPI002B46ACCC|nr:methylmalonyl Co-A mutase-associated GTPase MeaB [Noviherbaspirillum sp.]HJV79684.1 methylmalonyl Co-A mutase-associated GTPase MeaB [Noviherbaspirillum sp.]